MEGVDLLSEYILDCRILKTIPCRIIMGGEEDDNSWVYGVSAICACIVFVVGMGVFSAVYFGIPGIVKSGDIGIVMRTILYLLIVSPSSFWHSAYLHNM